MICSHNSFTYMCPLKWWMRLLTPFARCQNHSMKVQRSLCVQVADIRVTYYDYDWYVSHGPVLYCNLQSAIAILNDLKIDKLRLLVEGKYTPGNISLLDLILSREYNGTVYEFRDKKTWKQIKLNPTLEIEQYVGSMKSWYGKIFPKLYHILHPWKVARMQALATNSIYSFDFV